MNQEDDAPSYYRAEVMIEELRAAGVKVTSLNASAPDFNVPGYIGKAYEKAMGGGDIYETNWMYRLWNM